MLWSHLFLLNIHDILIILSVNNSCRYTLKVLSDIGDGEKVSDQVIIDWVNNTLKQGQKDSYINSFKVNPFRYQ